MTSVVALRLIKHPLPRNLEIMRSPQLFGGALEYRYSSNHKHISTQNLFCREEAIEFGIQVVIVGVIAVFRVFVEVFPENVRCCRLSFNQSASTPTFACCNPYAFSFFQEPCSPQLTANTIESMPETG